VRLSCFAAGLLGFGWLGPLRKTVATYLRLLADPPHEGGPPGRVDMRDVETSEAEQPYGGSATGGLAIRSSITTRITTVRDIRAPRSPAISMVACTMVRLTNRPLEDTTPREINDFGR
jgi:hypothetical protein